MKPAIQPVPITDPTPKSRILIVGGGYLGERLVRHYLPHYQVHLITRTLGKLPLWEELKVHHRAADITNSKFRLPKEDYTLVILCAAVTVDRKKKNSRELLYKKGTRNLLGELIKIGFQGRLAVVGSTSMVPTGGPWEDAVITENMLESARPLPPNLALQQWNLCREFAEKGQFKLLYLAAAGIYGPGRYPGLKILKGLQATSLNPDKWINLIHIEDLTRAVIFILEKLPSESLFFIGNGQAITRGSLYRIYSQILKIPPAEFTDPAPGDPPPARGKKISNQRLLNLGFHLNYPEFQESLENIRAAGWSDIYAGGFPR